ncbi:chitinase [Aliivibrio fischeri]|uniref:Ig-like domain-containing protein n=1 Tax=Aliivibrio fischeri TaxID=668 RepID=UPI0012DA18A0|nr:Ig-like domain-containing protein [Aliivibrio fischeri]MCE7566797.1 Ig-like domain-containing protein [Aliivibrio fischeri]MUK93781.1 chitinase [Aliivibrio fischeri]
MKGIFIKSAIASALFISYGANAFDCSSTPIWQSTQAYSGGDTVQQNNIAYQAQWWSQGNDPETHSGEWQEWKNLGKCSTGGENIAPTVTIISPINNAIIPEASLITLQASADDKDGSITQVEFLSNNQSIAIVTSPPYNTPWIAIKNTTSITVIATDDEGATTTESVSIKVQSAGELVPPTIELTSPIGNEKLTTGDTLVVSANANDSDGVINNVEFYIDNQLAFTDTEAPFEYSWLATSGPHQFKAKATDNDNQTTISKGVTLEVSEPSSGGCAGLPQYKSGTNYAAGDEVQNLNQKYRCDIGGWCSSSSDWAYAPGTGSNWQDAWTGLGVCSTPPQVTITSPNDNSVILAGSIVEVNASASDSDGSVIGVEFFANNVTLGSDTQAPYTVNWDATVIGSNTLKAVATDNEGNNSENSILVTVSDQNVVTALTSPITGSSLVLGKITQLKATATSLSSSITKVDFLVNGVVIASDTTSPYSVNWTPAAIGAYTLSVEATDAQGNTALSTASSVSVVEQTLAKHKLIGYWHNFVNGSGCPIRLADMSDEWDIIDIAFADNDRNSNGTVHFNLYSGDIHSSCPALDPTQFKQDMAALQAKGKVFVLSLGGAEGTITLNTDNDEVNFVNSLTAIIDEWGFDGLDIDLESGSNLLHGTQIQARLPTALKQIEANMGGDMYLTMAPEHPYVQGGMIAYSGIWGAYIPVINQVRDTLDLLHVQLYNNGGLPNPYMPGSAPEGSVDMMVASVKMLVEGFELADGTFFAPLRDDQVAIGLPSGPSSANSGQAPIQNIVDALDCVTYGTACSSVVPSKLYSNFGGVMTWSINWDLHDGFNFSKPVGDKLNQMNNQ